MSDINRVARNGSYFVKVCTMSLSKHDRLKALSELTLEEGGLIKGFVKSLEELVEGKRQPLTPAQEHFKDACLLKCDPETPYEIAFLKYQDAINQILEEKANRVKEIKELNGEPDRPYSIDSNSTFCSICHGDGGPGGRCWKCGGTGFAKEWH